jgi:hypothetical protein
VINIKTKVLRQKAESYTLPHLRPKKVKLYGYIGLATKSIAANNFFNVIHKHSAIHEIVGFYDASVLYELVNIN